MCGHKLLRLSTSDPATYFQVSSAVSLNAVVPLEDGSVWFSGPLLLGRVTNNQVLTYDHAVDPNAPLTSGPIALSSGRIWAAEFDATPAIVAIDGGVATRFALPTIMQDWYLSDIAARPGEGVTCLFSDFAGDSTALIEVAQDGSMSISDVSAEGYDVVATASDGTWFANYLTPTLTFVSTDGASQTVDLSSYGSVNDILLDGFGRLWVATPYALVLVEGTSITGSLPIAGAKNLRALALGPSHQTVWALDSGAAEIYEVMAPVGD